MHEEDLNRDCGRVRGELAAYLYEELTGETRAAVERHLAECVPCTDELATLRDTRALLAKWETPPAAEDPRELARSIAAAARVPRSAARPWRLRIVRWSAAVSGAAAALVLTLGVLDAKVSAGGGRFEIAFGDAAPAARGEALDPALRQELQAIAAQEVALRAADLEQSQEELAARISRMTQEELLRLSRAVDLALAQTQREWDTRLTSLGRDAARADRETRDALAEFASYLPVVNPSNR